MSKTQKPVPLIKRPIAEVLEAARNAGAAAFAERGALQKAGGDLRREWIAAHLPDASGLSAAEFGQVRVAASEAFDLGVESSLAETRNLTELEEANETAAGIVREMVGLFNAIARLERDGAAGQRDHEIAALASIGAGLGESVRNILDAALVVNDAHEHAVRKREIEHA